MKNEKLLESWEVKVGFILLVLMIIFGGRAKAQCNCDCDITPYQVMTDTVKLDSLFRHEQMTILELQRDMIKDDSKDLRSLFDCHALKMEIIYKRMESLKFKIEKP